MVAGPINLTEQLSSVPSDTKRRSGLPTDNISWDVSLLGPIADVIKTEASPERFLLWKLGFPEFQNPVTTHEYCTRCSASRCSVQLPVTVVGSILYLCSGGPPFECRPGYSLSRQNFRGLRQSLPDKCRENTLFCDNTASFPMLSNISFSNYTTFRCHTDWATDIAIKTMKPYGRAEVSLQYLSFSTTWRRVTCLTFHPLYPRKMVPVRH
jgi:hypothetical protein